MTHTPGPWHVERTAVYDVVMDSEGRNITFISIKEPEEAKANNRLIAAAPELLEACKDALKEFEAVLQGTCDDIGERPLTRIERQLRAVITAAEGK